MQQKNTLEPLLAIFSPLLYEKPHYVVKPNGIECLAKLDVTNDVSRLVYYANVKQSLVLL